MKISYLLILVFCIINCAGAPHTSTDSECERLSEANKKVKCYEVAIRTAVNNQFHSDFMDYAQMETTYDMIQDVEVSVHLTNDGNIKNIKLLATSGDVMLDNLLMQTIKNASPFALPAEEELKQPLLQFNYTLKL